MSGLKRVAVAAALFITLVLVAFYVIYGGGKRESAGRVHGKALPASSVARHRSARVSPPGKQILFGDLHVHTTFSADAFMLSLPLLGGEGAHPPADACDFARFCSGLDFFAITDHAEALTPRRWRETKESIRQCNAVANDPQNPDLVAFVGFEWTQVGLTAAAHYGHKNVIFPDLAEDRLPTRPIDARGFVRQAFNLQASVGIGTVLSIPLHDFSRRQRYLDLVAYARETQSVRDCPTGVDVRQLPADCRESAATPEELFSKLRQWGFPALVIPHGSTWGYYTPPGYSYDKQLDPKQHDGSMQRLIEVMSGHGNSEEYRPFRSVGRRANGELYCPPPRKDFEPCCYRAGEIIRSRCAEPRSAECEDRVRLARQRYVQAGVSGHLTVPGAAVTDWANCDQCQDCFLPSFAYRPRGSAQYILARARFDSKGKPHRAFMGFMASSDNHTARPGTGYKEFARRGMTEASGAETEAWRQRIFAANEKKTKQSRVVNDELRKAIPPWRIVHSERQMSFFYTGGLVAVHSDGRDRKSVWNALMRREVYGTSGPRILLWFDIVGHHKGTSRAPMGSVVRRGTSPQFEVKALGSFVQKPGCPDWSAVGLAPARVKRLCKNECYHPGDKRRRITRVELVRIFPQNKANEDPSTLIHDVHQRVDCLAKEGPCQLRIEDPGFLKHKRDAIYYVRAIEESGLAINASGLRCKDKACKKLDPCYGDYRVDAKDDCLAPVEQRAWSSPIYVKYDPALAVEDPVDSKVSNVEP